MNTSDQDRILTLELNQKTMAEKLQKIENKVDEMNSKFDLLIEKLEHKFVMRVEFNVWLAVLWAISLLIWIIVYFIGK